MTWTLQICHYLRQNPGEIGGAGAVPQEHPVVQRAELLEPLILSLPRDLEDLLNLELVQVVGRGVRVLHVLLEHPELGGLALQNLKENGNASEGFFNRPTGCPIWSETWTMLT